ncbi:MAG: hypothetical protein AABW54_02885 [Candidatus Micrarchaeota archaeon]
MNVQVNKAGIASLAAGVIVLALTLTFAFSGSITSLLVNGLVIGGIAWIGLILLVLGILIMVI